MGYSRAMRARRVIGIAQSQRGFNNGCIEGRNPRSLVQIQPPQPRTTKG